MTATQERAQSGLVSETITSVLVFLGLFLVVIGVVLILVFENDVFLSSSCLASASCVGRSTALSSFVSFQKDIIYSGALTGVGVIMVAGGLLRRGK